MRKILHTYRYIGTPWEILRGVTPATYVLETLQAPTRECLIAQVSDADFLLVSGRLRIDAEVLEAASHLRMIQRTGVGKEMLDLEAIKQRGIPVYVNAGVNSRSVAEHTMMLILACLKRLPEVNAQTHQGIWNKQETGVTTHELFGKTVGLVGMGHIGREVAALLQAFGARVFYTDIYRQSEDVELRLGLSFFESLDQLIPHVDILSLHCPLTENSVGMINSRTLMMMKSGAIIINTARGPLVNPDDLYDALLSGHIYSAGLDTHYEEPIGPNYQLSALQNVIMTPHIGGLTYEAFRSMMKNAIDNIVSFDKGNFESIENKRLL